MQSCWRCLHFFFFFSFSLVLRLDNSEPLDFGQVAYYNRGLQGDDIQMSNIPGRYWQPCQTLLLIMFIDQTVDKVLLFVNRTSLQWQLWAEGTNGLMQMCFTVENLLISFIQMVGFCGTLSSPHHSGSHHIGDSQWCKQSTRWWRSQRFPWKMMNYCRLFGCTDRSEPEKRSHRLPIFFFTNPGEWCQTLSEEKKHLWLTKVSYETKIWTSEFVPLFSCQVSETSTAGLLAAPWLLCWCHTVKIRLTNCFSGSTTYFAILKICPTHAHIIYRPPNLCKV